MSDESGPRRFVLPLIGIVLLFAVLGPAIGGALFFPLAIVLKPPVGADTLALAALIAAMFGHTIALVAAYVVGVGPAAATGFPLRVMGRRRPGTMAPRAGCGRHRRGGRVCRPAAPRRDRRLGRHDDRGQQRRSNCRLD